MKHMFITGANSGIGLSTFLQCFENGIFPIGGVRREQEFRNELNQMNIKPDSYEIVEMRMEEIKSLEKLVPKIKTITKSLDALVLNAGAIETAPSLMTSIESIERHLKINFTHQIYIAQSIAKSFFIKKRKGSIVAISSSAAIDANPGRLAYAASKSALTTAIRVMSKELGSVSIRCNVVAPGLTETKLMRSSTEDEQIKLFTQNISIKRLGKPNEIADTIHFLCSDKASFITGQVINVDGGIR